MTDFKDPLFLLDAACSAFIAEGTLSYASCTRALSRMAAHFDRPVIVTTLARDQGLEFTEVRGLILPVSQRIQNQYRTMYPQEISSHMSTSDEILVFGPSAFIPIGFLKNQGVYNCVRDIYEMKKYANDQKIFTLGEYNGRAVSAVGHYLDLLEKDRTIQDEDFQTHWKQFQGPDCYAQRHRFKRDYQRLSGCIDGEKIFQDIGSYIHDIDFDNARSMLGHEAHKYTYTNNNPDEALGVVHMALGAAEGTDVWRELSLNESAQPVFVTGRRTVVNTVISSMRKSGIIFSRWDVPISDPEQVLQLAEPDAPLNAIFLKSSRGHVIATNNAGVVHKDRDLRAQGYDTAQERQENLSILALA